MEQKHLILQKASAGSGKTFQLALNYIRLVLGETDPETGRPRLYYPKARNKHREILAVTFTNKATEEMKQRIIAELGTLSDPNGVSNYRTTLCKEFQTDAETLAKAARMALSDMLFDYGNFHVSTIDAFFQTVLRSFAYEADLSGNYDLQLEDQIITEQAINETIGVATGNVRAPESNSRMLRQWIRSYITDLRNSSKSFDLLNPDNKSRETLIDFVGSLSDENYKIHKKEIDSFTEDKLAIENVQKELVKKDDALTLEIRKTADALYSRYSTILIVKAKNFADKARLWPIEEPGLSNSYKVFLKDPNCANTFIKNNAKATAAEVDDAIRLGNELMYLIRLWFTVKVMRDQIHNYGLFSEILRFAEKLKVSTNTIMLSDTNTLLNRIIDESPSPFIYERIGRRLKHFLIDEFQDTSRLQWSNLKPLLQESLSEGNDNLIIGDVKQCIYRFRNSDPYLLDRGLEDDREIQRHINPQPHNTNFRSAKDLVEFNNALFSHISQSLGKSSVYATVNQTPNSKEPGYVRIGTPAEKSSGLDVMLEEMQRQLDPQGGGYQPGDIAVLARTRKEGRQIVDFLLQQTVPGGALEGVSILSDEALYISSSKAVQHIIRQLRELATPKNAQEEGEEEIVRYSTSDIEMNRINDRLHELVSKGMSPAEALDLVIEEVHSSDSTLDSHGISADELRGRSLHDIVEQMIKHLPIEEWRRDEAVYLCAFQDIVLEFCQRPNPNLYDFLDYWDNTGQDLSVGLSSDVNAIQVLTIHKSKGLEYPCIHLPIMPEDICKENSFRWYKATDAFAELALPCKTPDFFSLKSSAKMLYTLFADEYNSLLDDSKLDELNGLYVAFTRAKSELCVTLHRSDKEATHTTRQIRQALELMTGNTLNPEEPWTLTFGQYTHKAPDGQKKGAKEVLPYNAGGYQIYNRENVWTFTEVATEEE